MSCPVPPSALEPFLESVWTQPNPNSRSIRWKTEVGEFDIMVGGHASQVHWTATYEYEFGILVGTFAFNDNVVRAKQCAVDIYRAALKATK
jgi:hypothetical protein